MSKLTQRNGMRPADDQETCPICKTSRYLNPNMKFLVNPECYHKMCSACVDRIFSAGPAPCPVAGCHRTLRKARFRAQTFEDIQVEREVDIRRRVAATFNRREEEFETLLDYNNYLEEVETITFNLLNGIDLSATEKKLANYAAQNAQAISANASRASREAASLSAQQAAEREAARLRREAARREEEEEREEREELRREALTRLAAGNQGEADRIAHEMQKIVLKKSTARKQRQQMESLLKPRAGMAGAGGAAASGLAAGADNGSAALADNDTFVIKGLKPTLPVEPEKPYDPFGGYTEHREYYVLKDTYEHPWLDDVRSKPQFLAGGYDVHEYYARTMFEAFSGLCCFVGDEVAAREKASSGEVATTAAAEAAGAGGGDINMDDVF
ncbi:CDK-activating kinase assembly factor [Xylona heveae TC161]|uniref:RNA polymerase II transcription factor B subunit 3 n=1 Tax=Xylona heveae (strain CBS 132557 / TC161) TaxID=1328760 RepID=A0A165JF22_XYLHT|nr:CDK-activating kinase assembly factor [Xylona heveae TC161]KZF26152.1 CDK-activating kinase assembly factor [Xylona heveae TC161]